MLTFDKQSWHARLYYRFHCKSDGSCEWPTNLCWYFWWVVGPLAGIIVGTLLLFGFFPFLLTMVAHDIGANYLGYDDGRSYSVNRCPPQLWWHCTGAGVFLVVAVIGGITLLMLALLGLTKTGIGAITRAFFKAIKERYCPLIGWTETEKGQ